MFILISYFAGIAFTLLDNAAALGPVPERGLPTCPNVICEPSYSKALKSRCQVHLRMAGKELLSENKMEGEKCK